MIKTVEWPLAHGSLNIAGTKYTLKNIQKALKLLGNPEKRIPFPIHIAGTNGKGSTTAFLESILKAAAFRSNVYTSPNLVFLNERIKIEGGIISDDKLQSLLNEIKTKLQTHKMENDLSFFEGFTAAAFLAFSRSKSDFSLIEAGLGGRLDATNVMDSKLCVLTSISFDHTEILGKTIKEIALEKLAIQRPNAPFIIAHQSFPEVYELGKTIENSYIYGRNFIITPLDDSFLYESQNLKIELPLPSLPGVHQLYNAATAIQTLEAASKEHSFTINESHIKNGIQEAIWPARLQKITEGKIFENYPRLQVYIDGAHNEDGIKAALTYFTSTAKNFQENIIICGFLKRKEVEKIAPLFKNTKNLFAVSIHSSEESHSGEALYDIFKRSGILLQGYKEYFIEVLDTIQTSARVLILGSLYLAGEILEYNIV